MEKRAAFFLERRATIFPITTETDTEGQRGTMGVCNTEDLLIYQTHTDPQGERKHSGRPHSGGLGVEMQGISV